MDETIHGLAGATSGVLAACVWYPLETIRLRLQQLYLEDHKNRKISFTSIKEKEIKLKDNTEKNNQTTENDNKLQNNVKFTGLGEESSLKSKTESLEHVEGIQHTILFIKKIITEEGVKGLYSGISSCLVGSIFSYGIYFFAYQYWKNYFVKHNLNRNVVFDSLCTSFLGALVTAVSTNPFWVINARMSQSKSKVRLLFL